MQNLAIFLIVTLTTACGGTSLQDGNQTDAQPSEDGSPMADASPNACGNQAIDPGEECDDDNLNDVSCTVLGFGGGTLGCTDECSFDLSSCIGGCGNGELETGEVCDGSDFGGQTCQTATGHAEGYLTCLAPCVLDTTMCSTCGDGVVEGRDECDDEALIEGDGCDADCRVEAGWTCEGGPSTCTPICGDGVVLGTEACDDAGESATCDVNCTLVECGDGLVNTSAGEACDDAGESASCDDDCSLPECGDGILNTASGEGCDDGNTASGDGCDASCQLTFACGDTICDSALGETCQLCQPDCCPNCGNGVFETPQGEECDQSDFGLQTCELHGCLGGVPSCTSWCTLDLSSCSGFAAVCGNDTAECFEACDQSDLRGETCSSQGYAGGTLTCNSNCEFDYSTCGPPTVFYQEDFEDPTAFTQWSFTGDWEVGVLSMWDDPQAAYSGMYAIATDVGGNYSNGTTYDTNRAISPPISLVAAAAPALRFYMWNDTETCCDGFAMFISTNGGTNWSHLPNPTPAYTDTVGGFQCWQENSAISPSWTQVDFDLSAYAGQTINLGFSFYSDNSVTLSGAHVDDILVAEASVMP